MGKHKIGTNRLVEVELKLKSMGVPLLYKDLFRNMTANNFLACCGIDKELGAPNRRSM